MTVINTNVGALTARTYAVAAGESMQKAMERLSSGLRINSAADDAAGLSVANKMESQMRGMNVAIRNSQDGISLVQTAEAGMGEITNMIIRMRELAVQMNNGVYTSSDRANAQLEINALLAEVDKIAENTAFNDVKVLDGTYSKNIRAGNTNPEVILVAIDSMKTDALAAVAPVANESSATGTSSNYAIRSSDVTVSAQEAFRVTVGAPTPSATGTELEQFATIYSGGTYSLEGDDAASYTIAADGSITSNAAVSYTSGASNEVSLIRKYTSSDGAEVFSENITLSVTEDTAKSLVRAATSTLTVAKSDDLTINAVDTASVVGGVINYAATVNRGSLSSELAAFIDTAGNANGVFTLGGADAANYDVDADTGAITLKTDVSGGAQYDLSANAALTLTYTTENGDAFVETIAITAQTAVSSATTLSVARGDSGDLTYDATSASFASAELRQAITDVGVGNYQIHIEGNTGGSAAQIDGGTNAAQVSGAANTFTIGASVADGSTFNVVLKNAAGTTTLFTETVTISATDARTDSSLSAFALSGARTATESDNDVQLNLNTDDGSYLSFDLTSANNVSQEFLRAAGQAGTGVQYVISAGSHANINGGLASITGSSFNFDGDLAQADLQALEIEVQDSSGNALHTETFTTATVDNSGGSGSAQSVTAKTLAASATTASAQTVTQTFNYNGVVGDDVTFDLTNTSHVSQSLIDAAASITAIGGTAAYRLTGAVAGFNGNVTAIAGSSFTIDSGTSAGNIVIEVYDSADTTGNADTYHTETVNFTYNAVTATTTSNTVSSALDANTTVANTSNTVTNNTTVGLDTSASVTAATADSTAGTNARATSALSAVESNRVKVELASLSSQFAAYVAANTGGEFTISGTDAALFDINSTTGEVSSKKGLDREAATDSDTDNQYDFTITYTSGSNTYYEVVNLTVTDFADDNGETLKDVDLSTQAGSATAVTILDSALSQISSSQAKLGAIQNRLQHNIDNLSMASMLTETSRGRIVDADFARETSELSKQQILNQAATSMLAQANQSKQSVLALLQ